MRVDVFAPDRESWRVESAHRALQTLLTETDGELPNRAGADQGVGVEGQPVIGLTFWVRADDVGAAAKTALSTAVEAAASGVAGPAFYDVVVIPASAVAAPAQHKIEMPD